MLVSNALYGATKTWDGGGADNNWSTAANWDLDVAPVAGDALIFDGSTRTSPSNDFAAATNFASITFAATASAFTLSGNSVTITGGASAITANNTSLTMTIGNNIIFSTSAPTITTTSGGTLAISGTVANGGFAITVSSAGTATLSGIVSGTGSMTTSGAGTLTLSAANTFSGGITLSAGTLNINNATALGTGTFTISGGTINNTSGGSITNSSNNVITWSGNFTFTGSNALNLGTGAVDMGASTRTATVSASTLTFGGIISGTSGLIKAGAGTLQLGTTSGAHWTGSVTVSAGTLNLGAPSSDNYKATTWTIDAGATMYNNNGGNIIVNTAVITVNGTWNMNSQKDAIGYIAGSGNVTNFGTSTAGDGFEIDLPSTGTGSDFSGVISGPGTFKLRGQQGSGKQVLSGLNTYTGPTYIQKGTLSINTIKNVNAGASAIGNPANASDGTIPIGSTTNTAILEYTGTTNSTDRVIDLAGTTGGATIDQSGTGTLTFSSDLTATGVGSKTLTLQGSTAGAGVISGIIPDGSGTTSLAKSGTGTWTISGANTYGGTTTINAGTLQLGAAGVIPDASAVTANGTMDMNTYSEAIGSLAGSGTVDNAAGGGTPTLTTGGNNTSTTFSGVIKNTSGTLSLTKSGSGTFTISGSNTYTGTTTITAGTLLLGASGVISNSSNVVMNGGTFSTGSGAGYSETVGTLKLNANSIIALGTGSHNLNFAASNGTTWTGGTLLRITGWQGSWNCTSGTSGKIYTGSSAELSGTKLAQIFFTHPISGLPYTACQLSDGEIVPTGTLPVKLVSFYGEREQHSSVLHWITASEINSDYFEILRSSDDIHFESIGRLSSAGNSTDFISYRFEDSAAPAGFSYYKLVQYDSDGKSESFKTIAINNSEDAFRIIDLYPNPVSTDLTVSFTTEASGSCYIKIVDAQGKEVYVAMIAAAKGENVFKLPATSFAEGQYTLMICNADTKCQSKQFIVKH
ncbi:MAG: autotransporter-associated beta strand repeat-containing protein [Flavobacteriales bacterium]